MNYGITMSFYSTCHRECNLNVCIKPFIGCRSLSPTGVEILEETIYLGQFVKDFGLEFYGCLPFSRNIVLHNEMHIRRFHPVRKENLQHYPSGISINGI